MEREYAGRTTDLERQLESKTTWAHRLDDNIRAITRENKELASVSFAFACLPVLKPLLDSRRCW